MAKAQHNQNILDIATQQSGSVLASFDWAVANGISITDKLAAGQVLTNAFSVYENQDIANFFAGKQQLIATAISQEQIDIIDKIGIGTMIIENNFIVAPSP